MTDPAMAIPAGKTCRDCAHFKRCELLFSANASFPSSTSCDWAPSRFVEPVRAAARPAGVLAIADRMARPGGYVSPLWPPPGDPRAAHGAGCPTTCPCRRAR